MSRMLHGYGDGSKPISINFIGMNIHLPAVLWFTRYQGYDPYPYDFKRSSSDYLTVRKVDNCPFIFDGLSIEDGDFLQLCNKLPEGKSHIIP